MHKQILSHGQRNLVGYLALFVALGGTSYAAIRLPANVVTTKHLRNGSVTSAKVKNNSLRAVDFAKNQLPAGRQGPAGLPGPAGPPGPSGGSSAVSRKGPRVENPGVASSTAMCEGGERAVGGGGTSEGGFLWESIPAPEGSSTPTGWTVRAAAGTNDVMTDATAWVICVSSS